MSINNLEADIAARTVEMINPNDQREPHHEVAGVPAGTENVNLSLRKKRKNRRDALALNSDLAPTLEEGEIHEALADLGIEIDRSTDTKETSDVVSAHLRTIYQTEMKGAICPIAEETVYSLISALYLATSNKPVSASMSTKRSEPEASAEVDYDFSFVPEPTRIDLDRLPPVDALATPAQEVRKQTRVDRETKLDQ